MNDKKMKQEAASFDEKVQALLRLAFLSCFHVIDFLVVLFLDGVIFPRSEPVHRG